MGRLIRLQLRNILHSKVFYVCLVFTAILTPILGLIAYKELNLEGDLTVCSQIKDIFTSEPTLMAQIFIALMFCMDFNEGTTKNIIARGYSNMQLFVSKCITVIISLFGIYLLTALVNFVIYFKEGMGFNDTFLMFMVYGIVSIITMTIFYGAISYILEKNGIAIIAVLFAPNIIGSVLGIISDKISIPFSDYWLTYVGGEFLVTPTWINLILPVAVFMLYILFILVGTSFILKKKEIK